MNLFLPRERPKLAGYEFADCHEPAQRGNDGGYLDYIQLPNGRLAVALGDFAGKGTQGLSVARLYSSVREQLINQPDTAAAMTALNAEFFALGLGSRFITCLLMVIDPQIHQLTLVNAGHLSPLRRDAAGNVDLIGLAESGLPLGIASDHEFQPMRYDLSRGESWLAYTDGVTDAMFSSTGIWGASQLTAVVASSSSKIENLVNALVKDGESFFEGRPQNKDKCVVGFQRLP